MKVGQRTKASVVIKCKRRRDGSQQGGGVLSGFVDSGNVEGGRDLQNQLFQHLIISRSITNPKAQKKMKEKNACAGNTLLSESCLHRD